MSLAPGKFVVSVVNTVMLLVPKVDKPVAAVPSIFEYDAPG